jgi:hypothetical protein
VYQLLAQAKELNQYVFSSSLLPPSYKIKYTFLLLNRYLLSM